MPPLEFGDGKFYALGQDTKETSPLTGVVGGGISTSSPASSYHTALSAGEQ